MNTPAHVILNALVLGRGRWRRSWFPITAGALTPDLPMLGFYLYQRLAVGAPERLVWSQAYFQPEWQRFFDLFNSLPLIAVGAGIAAWLGARAWLAFFLSMALHCITDLPLHHEDAHGHLFPLSTWRFRSPVSYWDPRYHGSIFLMVELFLVAAGATALTRRAGPWRAVGVVTLALYAAFALFAIVTWGIP